MKIAVGILGVALVATMCDYTWYALHVRHSMIAGIIHGAVLLTAVGAVLGLDAGRLLKGLPIGALAGVGGALIYYLVVALVDRRTDGAAIPAAWIGMWLLIAARWPLVARAPAPAMGRDCDSWVARRGTERDRVLPRDEYALGPARRDRQELFAAVRRVGGGLGAGSAGVDAGSFTSHGSSGLTVADTHHHFCIA
jgi:hypothetical protein